jgi:hypothetical protein
MTAQAKLLSILFLGTMAAGGITAALIWKPKPPPMCGVS